MIEKTLVSKTMEQDDETSSTKSIPFSVWGPLALLVLSFLPLVFLHLRSLWGTEHYQHFPFVLAAVGFLGWNRLNESTDRRRRPRFVRAMFLGAGLLWLVAATLIWSPWLAMVALIFVAGAVMIPERLTAVWLLLWLLIPLPANLDQDLPAHLQGVASGSASFLLDFVGTDHVLTGYTIEVPGRQFLVEEACSGIHSLFVLIAFTAIYVAWQRRGWFHSLLLLLSAVGWATLVNLVRVALVVVVEGRTGFDVSHGLPHDILGMVLFLFALGMLLSTDRWFLFLFVSTKSAERSRRDSESPKASRKSTKPGSDDVSPIPWRVGWLLAVPFAATLVLQVGPLLEEGRIWKPVVQELEFFDETTLPNKLGSWTQVSYHDEVRDTRNDLGSNSAVWTFSSEGLSAVVSFDYPFFGWHHLPNCYRSVGWRDRSFTAIGTEDDTGSASGDDVEVALETATENAMLLFCVFDREQNYLKAPWRGRYSLSYLREDVIERLRRFCALYGYQGRTYQIQVFCPNEGPLTDQQKTQLRELYVQAKDIIMDKSRAQL